MWHRLFDRLKGKKGAAKPPSEPDTPDISESEAIKAAGDSAAPGGSDAVKAQVIEAIRTVYDPEIPVDIYELGLIYDLDVDGSGTVDIKMTLTAPACPAAGFLPGQVESVVRGVPGVNDVKLELVWDPPWTPDRMSDAARLELGML